MKTSEMIKVMVDHDRHGLEIECKPAGKSGEWKPVYSPCWNWSMWDYRIKAQPPKKVEMIFYSDVDGALRAIQTPCRLDEWDTYVDTQVITFEVTK